VVNLVLEIHIAHQLQSAFSPKWLRGSGVSRMIKFQRDLSSVVLPTLKILTGHEPRFIC